MANTYKKPVVLENDELTEGVYAASGADENSQATSSEESNNVPHCDSIYIAGNYVEPNGSNWQGTNMTMRGCEGCPACWSDGKCHVETYPTSMQGQFKPGWEARGKGPNDPGNA